MKYKLVTVKIKDDEVEIPDGCIPVGLSAELGPLIDDRMRRIPTLTYLEPCIPEWQTTRPVEHIKTDKLTGKAA